MGAALTRLDAMIEGTAVQLVVRDDPAVITLCRKLLDGGEYPLGPLGAWSPKLVVDVGANVGATSLLFALRHPSATVHALEPAAGTFALLRHNAKSCPRIHVHPFALLDQAGSAVLHHGGSHDQQNSLMGSRETGENGEPVKVVRARDFVSEVGVPDLLKVDTEGAELPILRDLADASLLEDISVVHYEFHSRIDRIELDALLRRTHIQFAAQQTGIHRGTCGWMHASFIKRFPRLDLLRIRHSSGG